MNTYTQILYQIVFGTKGREKTLCLKDRPELFKYVSGLLKNKNCHLYQIGGVSDHIHIVTHLHPAIALATLVKEIKLASSDHIKKSDLFPAFCGWQDGYGAFTYSISAKEHLIEYVKNQEVHHKKKSFQEELIDFFMEHGIVYDERYLI